MKILLISHGNIAEGFCSTLQQFFGATNVYAASVTAEGGTAALLDKINAYLDAWGDEQVVICSDLKGGSANQSALPFLRRSETYLVSGMNLGLLLQLSAEPSVDAAGLHEMIGAARDDMVLVNDLIADSMAGADDE